MLNDSKVGVADFLIYTADVEQKPNGEYRLLPAGESPYSCADWIKLSADRAQIGPQRSLCRHGDDDSASWSFGRKIWGDCVRDGA